MEDTVIFTVREAIPRTKGVLVHLSSVTPEIQKMFDSTYLNSRPFILFYSADINPFSINTERIIKADPCFRGEIKYWNEPDAIRQLSKKYNDLFKTI